MGFLSLAYIIHLFINLYISWNVLYFHFLIFIVISFLFIHTCNLFGLHSFNLAL